VSDDLHPGCEHLDDAASYALGALPDSEHASFVAHLSTCATCREEVAALQVVVSSLPATVHPMPAPADLKHRVMGTVAREAREQEAAQRISSPAARRSPRRVLRRPSWRPALVGVLAAGAVVLAVLLAFSGGGGGSGRTQVFRAEVTVPRATASVTVNGGHAALQVADLPQSPRGHIYELWIERAGAPQPTDALFTVSESGSATVGVPGNIKGVTAVMVTSEPLGGSKVPTTTPIIRARLS
jgi:anti-sigma-K factor RskA